jgi:delta 1-pyrroline-5-carboxylate dehydrogenase
MALGNGRMQRNRIAPTVCQCIGSSQAETRPPRPAAALARSAPSSGVSVNAVAPASLPDDLAAIVTGEHGKVLSDAVGEISRGLENVEYATGVPNLLKGGFSEQAATGVDVYSIRQPLGVVAGITPFNFPVMVPLWMCANAIATGNAFVLKPSEKDPSAALFLAQLWKDAGLVRSPEK